MCNRYRDELRRAKRASVAIGFCLFVAATLHAQTSFVVGICVHTPNDPSMLPRQLSVVGDAGANSLRDDISWGHVEIQEGRFAVPVELDDLVNQAVKANVQPLLILDYGNRFYDRGEKPTSPRALSGFARYAAFVVLHFKGRVHIYEMWNEWNDTAGNTQSGTPEDYTRFLRVVYPAVKTTDPSAVFVAGAIAGLRLDWLSAMLSAGALGSFDAISIHPYNFSETRRTADAWAEGMLATEAVIHRFTAGRDIPLYVTEMGWPTSNGPGGSSPKDVAVSLAQMFLLARTMTFLKGIWWYDFCDDGWDVNNKEDNFGLVDPNLEPKPAFGAFKAVGRMVRDARSVDNLTPGNPSIHALRFHFNGNNQVLALWSVNGPGPIPVHVMGGAPLQVRSIESDDYNTAAVQPGKKEQTLQISDIPVFITGTNLTVRSVK
jgi:polysaccharide biosynthesis protein PslG